MVKMKAVDTLHISAVGPDNIAPGGEFELNEADAKQLEDRGLAKRVGAKAEKAAPENKALKAAPANKGIISAASISKPADRPVLKMKGK